MPEGINWLEILIGAIFGLLTTSVSGLFWLAGVASSGKENSSSIRRMELESAEKRKELTIVLRQAVERIEMRQDKDAERVEEKIKLIEKRHFELDDRVMDKLSNIEKIVANIQGQLEIRS